MIFALILFDWLLGRQVLVGDAPVLVASLLLGVVEFHLKGWVQFVAIMRLAQVRDEGRLSWLQMWLGRHLLAVGLAWDVVMNVFATAWLLQLPFRRTAGDWKTDNRALAFLSHRQWLLSQRLEWNVYHGPEGWRKRWSEAFRSRLLDNIDPRGVHRS